MLWYTDDRNTFESFKELASKMAAKLFFQTLLYSKNSLVFTKIGLLITK